MDREQTDGVGALLLGDRLELPGADRLLLRDEPDEAFDVGPAKLLVRTGEPRELPQVRVTPAPVPLREHREVVVVLGDDLLTQPLEGEPRQRLNEPLVALPESAHQSLVALAEPRRQGVLESGEERPPRGDAPEKRERVVRDADERRREHRQERGVVVPVVEQAEIHEQIDDLLLAEIALAGSAVRRDAERA